MAARAIAEALSAVSLNAEVVQLDTILSSRCPLERFPPSFYIFTNKYAHWLWRAFYYWPVFRSRLSETITDRLFCSSNIPKLKSLSPDAVVSTHLCITRASVRLGVPTFAVVTDYVYHPFLFSEKVRAYFVASEEIRDALLARGFPADRIHLTGIPIRSMFWEPPSCADARARLGLPTDDRVVLLMSGNQGVTPVGRIARALRDSDAFILVVTGKNEPMRRRIERLFRKHGIKGGVFGVFQDMASLLCSCDIIVTKGGGIITSECLASGLPMVFYDSIPGQEEGNARVVSEWGAGVSARNADEAASLVIEIISDQSRLNRMKQAARSHGRPKAALDIASKVLGYIEST